MDITRSFGVATVLVILYSVQATAQIEQTQEAMRCVEKLMPCHPYTNSEIPPPPWCCNPVKNIVEKDVTCLCGFLNHPDVLALMHLTQDDALNLLSSCGANYDASVCTNNTISSPDASPGSTTSDETESSSASTTKNAALAISFLGFSFLLALRGF